MKYSDNYNMRISTSCIFIFIFTLFAVSSIAAQSDLLIDREPPEAPADAQTVSEDEFKPLPDGYDGIQLGMAIETVKEMLMSSSGFSYRGEPDVSMSPVRKQTVIDCDGVLYIDRGYFQFEDDRLYIITMVMDPEFIDHYSIYTAFREKYGEPEYLDPQKTVWEDGSVRISLERPLSLKYIDIEVFDNLQQKSSAEKSIETELRQDFLDSF